MWMDSSSAAHCAFVTPIRPRSPASLRTRVFKEACTEDLPGFYLTQNLAEGTPDLWPGPVPVDRATLTTFLPLPRLIHPAVLP